MVLNRCFSFKNAYFYTLFDLKKLSFYILKYTIIIELLKKQDIDKQILLLINSDKHIKITDEDLEFLNDAAYRSAI